MKAFPCCERVKAARSEQSMPAYAGWIESRCCCLAAAGNAVLDIRLADGLFIHNVAVYTVAYELYLRLRQSELCIHHEWYTKSTRSEDAWPEVVMTR